MNIKENIIKIETFPFPCIQNDCDGRGSTVDADIYLSQTKGGTDE